MRGDPAADATVADDNSPAGDDRDCRWAVLAVQPAPGGRDVASAVSILLDPLRYPCLHGRQRHLVHFGAPERKILRLHCLGVVEAPSCRVRFAGVPQWAPPPKRRQSRSHPRLRPRRRYRDRFSYIAPPAAAAALLESAKFRRGLRAREIPRPAAPPVPLPTWRGERARR